MLTLLFHGLDVAVTVQVNENRSNHDTSGVCTLSLLNLGLPILCNLISITSWHLFSATTNNTIICNSQILNALLCGQLMNISFQGMLYFYLNWSWCHKTRWDQVELECLFFLYLNIRIWHTIPLDWHRRVAKPSASTTPHSIFVLKYLLVVPPPSLVLKFRVIQLGIFTTIFHLSFTTHWRLHGIGWWCEWICYGKQWVWHSDL